MQAAIYLSIYVIWPCRPAIDPATSISSQSPAHPLAAAAQLDRAVAVATCCIDPRMPTGIRGHVTFCLLLPVAPAAQARMQRNGTHSLIPGSPATPTYVTAAASYSGTRRHSALACSAVTKGNCSLGTADHLPCSCSSCSLVVGLVLRTRVCAVRLHCSVAVRSRAGWAQNKNNSSCILPALQSYSFTTCNRRVAQR